MVSSVSSWLTSQRDLNLTVFDKAGEWDNTISYIELMPPNKSDALAYLEREAPAPICCRKLMPYSRHPPCPLTRAPSVDVAHAHSIGELQAMQWKLADMSIKLRAAQALVYDAARSGEGGFPDMLLAAQAKIFTSENAIQVVNDALQLFGARGYSRELPLERMARDVRMFTIGGGTAEVLRNVVAGALLKKKLPQTRDGWGRERNSL